MRVEVVVTVVTADWRVLRAGETCDLPDDLATSLIRSGVARAADSASFEETTAAPAETAVARPPRRRRDA